MESPQGRCRDPASARTWGPGRGRAGCGGLSPSPGAAVSSAGLLRLDGKPGRCVGGGVTERSCSCGPSRWRDGRWPPPSTLWAPSQVLKDKTFVHLLPHVGPGLLLPPVASRPPGSLGVPTHPPLLSLSRWVSPQRPPLPVRPGTTLEEGTRGIQRACPESLATGSRWEAASGCGEGGMGWGGRDGEFLPNGGRCCLGWRGGSGWLRDIVKVTDASSGRNSKFYVLCVLLN